MSISFFDVARLAGFGKIYYGTWEFAEMELWIFILRFLYCLNCLSSNYLAYLEEGKCSYFLGSKSAQAGCSTEHYSGCPNLSSYYGCVAISMESS